MLAVERWCVGAALSGVLFVPLVLSAWGWWATADGAARLVMVGLVIVTESLEFFGVTAAAAALASGARARAITLGALTVALAVTNAGLAHRGLSLAFAEAGRPTAAAGTGADLAALEREITRLTADRDALTATDWADPGSVTAAQMLIAQHAGLGLRGGFDGEAGAGTTEGFGVAVRGIDARLDEAAGLVARITAADAAAGATALQVITVLVILAILKISARWAFVGHDTRRDPAADGAATFGQSVAAGPAAPAGGADVPHVAPAPHPASLATVPPAAGPGVVLGLPMHAAPGFGQVVAFPQRPRPWTWHDRERLPAPPEGKVWRVEPPSARRPFGRCYLVDATPKPRASAA